VAVPPEKDPEPIRRFHSFMADSHALADWMSKCEVRTVAMESTGVPDSGVSDSGRAWL
jgi:hypothetical protein